ncbi:hypothetical protein [Streptomyces sp. NPDC050534]|uniref:hypothetical protein n=1 Tax=Streptomyces sp. NPDC050534 TaxID=3365625 RepID=UPI00378F4EC1
MRHRIGRRRTRNGVLAVALALVALAGVAGCGGGSKPPHKGQAAELFKWDVNDTAAMRKLPPDVVSALYALNTDATGIAYGSDGRLRVMTAYLLRFDADRTIHATDISGGRSVDWENHGLVAEPGGTFLTARGTDVLRWRPDGTSQVVAAFAAKDRKVGTTVPASAPVGTVHAGYNAPWLAGVRPDGSLVLVDTDVLWSLKDGRLTRLLQLPATGDKEVANTLMEDAAVNRSGTVWTASGPFHAQTLAGLRTVAPDGTVSRPALPARAEGVSEKLASLQVNWLTDDGADGVYAHVYSPGTEYVLHVRPGSARAVAKATPSSNRCTMPHHPVDAMSMSCTIPEELTYHAGHLVAAGDADYVLTLPLA